MELNKDQAKLNQAKYTHLLNGLQGDTKTEFGNLRKKAIAA